MALPGSGADPACMADDDIETTLSQPFNGVNRRRYRRAFLLPLSVALAALSSREPAAAEPLSARVHDRGPAARSTMADRRWVKAFFAAPRVTDRGPVFAI